METPYPALKESEVAFLRNHAEEMIFEMGYAWSLEKLNRSSRFREFLISLVKILCLFLLLICTALLVALFLRGESRDTVFFAAIAIFSILILSLLPLRHRFERWSFRRIWRSSSKKIASRLLNSKEITKDRVLEVLDDHIQLQGIQIDLRKIELLMESEAFIALLVPISQGFLTIPKFLFLRKLDSLTRAIKPASKKIQTLRFPK